MREGRFLRIGGYISGGVLTFFGIAVVVLGIWGFAFTRDHIEREQITLIFSIIVGVALLLTGIGLVILARAVFGRWVPAAQVASPTPEPGAAPG